MDESDLPMQEVRRWESDLPSKGHTRQLQPDVSQGVVCESGLTEAGIAASRAFFTDANAAPSTSCMSKVQGYITGRPPYEVENVKLQSENQRLRLRAEKLEREVKTLAYNCEEISRKRHHLGQEREELLRQREHLCQTLDRANADKDKVLNQRHEMERKGRKDQESIRHLQEQITHYKANISTATRPIDSVTDDVIIEKVDALFRNIQAFVVRAFKDATFDFDRLPEEWKKWMRDHIPYANTLPKAHWYNICVSVISRILVNYWDPKFYFGMSDKPPLSAAAELVVRLQPTKQSKTKTWLEATRELISFADPDVLRESEDTLKRHLVIIVENTIVKAMQVEWSEARRNELAKVLGSGLELFRTLHQQQAVFSVEMARAFNEEGAVYVTPEVMQDVENVEDEESLAERLVEISVFPIVYKRGGARGEDGNLSILCKARVVPESKPSKLRRKRCYPCDEVSSAGDSREEEEEYGDFDTPH